MALLEEYFLAEYKNFDGCLLPSEFFTVKEKIEHFDVRDSDIWIASYPKSGAKWLQELVWLLCNNLDYNNSSLNADQEFLLIEVNSLHKSLEIFHKKHDICVNLNLKSKDPDVFKTLNNNQNTRFIKTHLPWSLLPRQIKNGAKRPKIMYLLRHPKYTASLYYNHMANIFQTYKGTQSTFFDLFTKGKLLYGNYFDNALSYWDKKYLSNLRIVTHEDMRSDLKSVVKNVASFLVKTYSEEEIDELVHYLHFSNAKRNFDHNRSALLREEGREIIITNCCDPDAEFPEGSSEKLDVWVSENIYGTGLPYEQIEEKSDSFE